MARSAKFDNAKAILIFLVVAGHMLTDYVSEAAPVRSVTLWIYMFHMPAFVFISGLLHKRYVTSAVFERGKAGMTKFRADRALGFFLCGYALKVFLQFTRTLMGQNPTWHWIEEPGIPWYLFVMAEYEVVFYLLRRIDEKVHPSVVIGLGFVLSALIGYFPAVDDAFCLARMINFLPLFALGYYLDKEDVLKIVERRLCKMIGCVIMVLSFTVCLFGPWKMYGLRKWFTGRRSYVFLQQYSGLSLHDGWWIRLIIWGIAAILVFAFLAAVPGRERAVLTDMGSKTLNVYFWHRPLCYLFRNLAIFPKLCVFFGAAYDEALAGPGNAAAISGSTVSVIAAFIAYLALAAAVTLLFSRNIFGHPADDIMRVAKKIAGRGA